MFRSSSIQSLSPVFIPLLLLIIGHESSTLVEHMISPVILNLWASHVSDPFISIDALEVLEVMIFFFQIINNII